MRLLNRLERKFGRYAIDNFMLIVCAGQAMVYMADLFTDGKISEMIMLYFPLVLKGEIWRLISFVFVPSAVSPLSMILSLYFYYMVGSSLESEWGVFNTNVFYFMEIAFAVAAAAIGGFGDARYINQALFFAFAILYPDYEFLLAYVVPLKAKWVALIEFVLYAAEFRMYPFERWNIVLSLVPLVIFFFDNGRIAIKRLIYRIKNRNKYKDMWR